jgi:hypothetical protein
MNPQSKKTKRKRGHPGFYFICGGSQAHFAVSAAIEAVSGTRSDREESHIGIRWVRTLTPLERLASVVVEGAEHETE